MNYYEGEIAKYEKRLQTIDRKPRPDMLACNRLLYQALLDHDREQLRWWREGKPFMSASGGGMAILTRVFGEFRTLGLVGMADRMGSKAAEAAYQKIWSMGLPDYSCDRTILLLPIAASGVDLPKLSMILTRTGSCNVANNSHRTLAELMGIPFFMVDVPFEDPYQENLPYVVKQLHELIAHVEAKLPGAKFDGGRLMELQRLDRQRMAALHDIGRLRKHVPCPDHPRDVFREPLQCAEYTNPLAIVEYYETYRDELADRVSRGFTPVGEEKLRIVWAISGPYGSKAWDYLAQRGVSVPFWQYGGAEKNFIRPIYGDESEFGKALTPLEEVARTLLYNSWGGTGERWINDVVAACREFRADGLVLFEQTGCLPVLGLGKPVADRVDKEMGIPAWCADGRMLLGHTANAEAQFMAGLESFVNLCFERKGRR
ncbi:MAG: 2-hydroxyacyl-CoA dehydratase [Chloroflexi bacterium]|nr:2-hydroxyacyl-CoA dehydratase [Chloroflexota bacterium]